MSLPVVVPPYLLAVATPVQPHKHGHCEGVRHAEGAAAGEGLSWRQHVLQHVQQPPRSIMRLLQLLAAHSSPFDMFEDVYLLPADCNNSSCPAPQAYLLWLEHIP